MSDDLNVLPTIVDSDEWLARFILHGSHIRSDGTVRPDAFIPHPHHDLSVTRHLTLADERLWQLGEFVATRTRKTLHGRADVKAEEFVKCRLRLVAAPLDENQNHANVSGWPADKPAQKMIAMEIAARTIFVPKSSASAPESVPSP